MSVLICGSRHPVNPFQARLTVDEMVGRLKPGMVVLNGGADGIDAYVLDSVRALPYGRVVDTGTGWRHPAELVDSLRVTAVVFRARFRVDGRRAGILRNLHMLDLAPEMVVCLWNGSSNGTKHVIGDARRRGIETVVIDA